MDWLRHPIEAFRENWSFEKGEFRRDPAGYLAGLFALIVFGPLSVIAGLIVVGGFVLFIAGLF